MVFSALALSQCEVIWYFQHVGIASSKSTRLKTVDIVSYSAIIFSLDSISRCSSILLLSKSRGFLSSQKRNVVPFHTNCWLNFQDAIDPTIGFLLDGIGKLCCLVRKYIAGSSKPVALFGLVNVCLVHVASTTLEYSILDSTGRIVFINICWVNFSFMP
jgi:hypothetical protein